VRLQALEFSPDNLLKIAERPAVGRAAALFWKQVTARSANFYMPIPPPEIPENCTAEQYHVLSMLYGAMGNMRLALEASQRRAAAAEPAITEGVENAVAGGMSAEDAEIAREVGQQIASEMMNLLLGTQDEDASPDEQADKFMALMGKMRNLALQTGAKEEELGKFDEGMSGLLAALTKPPEAPPRTVPSDLSAQEYYDLGVRYKAAGWTEQARDALQYAMDLDGDGDVGRAALSFMRSKLPRHPVPLSAEQANIQGFNLMMSGDKEGAIALFRALMKDFPDFEWPQGNLGSILIEQGKFEEAERVLVNAVQLNPFYVNGWAHLSRANLLQSKYKEARYCIEQIRKADPNDRMADSLEQQLDTVQRWEEAGGRFD
jgi:tetratricopeptide (TPR) repeat protein